jgi:uncharacterized protein (UPF0303 family)
MSPTTEQFEAPDDLLAEESGLRLEQIDERTCYEIGRSIAERAAAEKASVAATVFLGDRPVFHVGFPGTTAKNDAVIAAKLRVAQLNGHSSLFERNSRLAQGTTFEEDTGLGLPEYAPFGGAVPLATKDGHVAGFVVVSGLTQEEDHEYATQGIRSVSS